MKTKHELYQGFTLVGDIEVKIRLRKSEQDTITKAIITI